MKKDYLRDVLTTLLCTLLFLILFSFIPEIKTDSFSSRKVDLLSDIRPAPVRHRPFKKIYAVKKDTVATAKDSIAGKTVEIKPPGLIAFEDYSDQGTGLDRFITALGETGKRPVRIAFLGDSFIEADILTQDIREQLQKEFGGRGVGYVPMASMTAGFRRTVVHSFNHWTTVSAITPKSMDTKYTGIAEQYFKAEEGANAFYKGVSVPCCLKNVNSATFLFVNRNNTNIRLKTDQGEEQNFTPVPADSLQCIRIGGEINSLRLRLDQTSGFTALGVYLNDSTGICLDNYSLRGTSGITLAQVNASLSREMSRYIPYDLIVLEYGQNVVSKDQFDYSAYASRMIKAIRHLQTCYPSADILVMGIGDRSQRGISGFETMPEIYDLMDAQRKIARETKSVFWDTFAAMGGENSMLAYVSHKPAWANKDYTHITHAGGKPIANKFIESVLYLYNLKKK